MDGHQIDPLTYKTAVYIVHFNAISIVVKQKKQLG